MSRLWKQTGNLILQDGKLILCDTCPCTGTGTGTGTDTGTGTTWEYCTNCLNNDAPLEVEIYLSSVTNNINCTSCSSYQGWFVLPADPLNPCQYYETWANLNSDPCGIGGGPRAYLSTVGNADLVNLPQVISGNYYSAGPHPNPKDCLNLDVTCWNGGTSTDVPADCWWPPSVRLRARP